MESYSGTWWLPPEPGVKRSGTIVIDERDGVVLHLSGSLRREREVALRRISEPVIHGMLEDGTLVTLLEPYHDVVNCLGQDYFARHTFIGTHTDASTVIEELRFTGTELDNFLGAPAGLRSDPAPLGIRRSATFRGHLLTFSVDRSDEAALADDQPRSTITVRDVSDWDTAWNVITGMSLLLTLLSGVENAVLNVTIARNGEQARVLTSTRTVAHVRGADRRASSLIATLADIADLDTLLARFDALEASLRHVLSPFVGYLRHPGDITSAASAIAQTLESYHRDRRHPDGVHRYRQHTIDAETFGLIRAALEATLQREFPHHVGVVHQLRNDRSLRERVRDLYREHHEFLDEITDEKTLIGDATSNRNRFSHAKKGDLSRDEVEAIFWAGERMRLLFHAILLTEFGFDQSAAHELLRRNDRFEALRGKTQQLC